MDLILANNDPTRTLLVAADGPRYEISTPSSTPSAVTTVVRIDGITSTGKVGTQLGLIEQKLQGTTLRLCSTDLELGLHPLSGTETEK